MEKYKSDPTIVEIVEHDRWSGPVLLEKRVFPTRKRAERWANSYNKKSCPATDEVPDYYVAAHVQ